MAKFCDFWHKAFKESSLLRNVIVLFTGIVIAVLFSLPFGINEVVEFVTNAVIIIVIAQVCGDMWFKVTKEPEKLCWQYWVGIAGVLMADWLFLFASLSTTFNTMFLRIGLCVAMAVASGLWLELAYKKVIENLKSESINELKKEWANKGIPQPVIEETLKEY